MDAGALESGLASPKRLMAWEPTPSSIRTGKLFMKPWKVWQLERQQQDTASKAKRGKLIKRLFIMPCGFCKQQDAPGFDVRGRQDED